jgi:hypothetical protein
LTFKDLHKVIQQLSQSDSEQIKLYQRLAGKHFWIWNVDEHKQEDIRTKGECCFNHIIGLPSKDTVEKPLYDYEKIIFDSLVTQNGNAGYSNNKTSLDKESNRAWYL